METITAICNTYFSNINTKILNRIEKGYGHECWKVMSEGKVYVIKILKENKTIHNLQNEVLAYKKAEELEINVPKILFYGKTIRDRCFYIHEWVNGNEANSICFDEAKFYRKFGEIIGKMHAVHSDYFSEDLLVKTNYKNYTHFFNEYLNRCEIGLIKYDLLPEKQICLIKKKLYR